MSVLITRLKIPEQPAILASSETLPEIEEIDTLSSPSKDETPSSVLDMSKVKAKPERLSTLDKETTPSEQDLQPSEEARDDTPSPFTPTELECLASRRISLYEELRQTSLESIFGPATEGVEPTTMSSLRLDRDPVESVVPLNADSYMATGLESVEPNSRIEGATESVEPLEHCEPTTLTELFAACYMA